MDAKEKKYWEISERLNKLEGSDPKEAAEQAREAAAQARKDGDEGYALFFEGEALCFEGKNEEAEKLEKQAVEKLPRVSFILSNYAVLLDKLDQSLEAISFLDKAIEIDPKNVHALTQKSASLSSLGREEEAISFFDKALALDPKSVYTLVQKGVSLSKLGREEEAISFFDKALELDPKNVHTLTQKGVSLSKLKREEEAISNYDKALDIDPTNIHALTQKGVSFAELGREAEAMELIEKAISINPKYDNAIRNKGALLSKIGQFRKSQDVYEKLKQIKAWDEIDYAWIVDNYTYLGELDKAKECANEWIKLLKEKKQSPQLANFKLAIIARLQKRPKKPEVKTIEKLKAIKLKPFKEPEEKKEEKEEFEDYMSKVLEHFGPKKIQEFLNEVKKKSEENDEKLKMKDHSKKFIGAPPDGFVSVLRRWNSYTPIVHTHNSKGGGYFLVMDGVGIVIDPGFDFVRNFMEEDFHFSDINCIFITHAHLDHMADLEALTSVFYEKWKRMKDETPKVNIYLNLGCMKKISGWLDVNQKYLGRVVVLERDKQISLTNDLTVLPVEAYHDETLTKTYSLGFIFQYKGIKRIGFTGDTGWRIENSLAKPYEGCKVQVVHLGSIYPKEFSETMEERLDKNHLGLLGISGMISQSKPELAVVSEFGEEVKNLRKGLAEGLTSALGHKTISADVGTEISLSDTPCVRCYLCGKFTANWKIKTWDDWIGYICERCSESDNDWQKLIEKIKNKSWMK